MALNSWMAILVAAFFAVACAGPSKSELDAEVKRLCAIDGGIKVHETVTLPRDKFNQWGQVNFYRPGDGENTLGLDYVFRREITYYRRGNPEMSRMHVQVARRADGKVLGELIRYGRGGGDVPGPWHGSSFGCPPGAAGTELELFKAIFLPVG